MWEDKKTNIFIFLDMRNFGSLYFTYF